MTWLQDALDGELAAAIVSTRRDPGELHLIAAHHNWDSDEDVPDRLSEHPDLDQGSALLLFWRTEPPEEAIGLGHEDSGGHPLSDLVDRLRERLLRDQFASHSIAVDLRADLGYNRLFIERLRRGGIPAALWGPSPGAPFDEAAVVDQLEARLLDE